MTRADQLVRFLCAGCPRQIICHLGLRQPAPQGFVLMRTQQSELQLLAVREPRTPLSWQEATRCRSITRVRERTLFRRWKISWTVDEQLVRSASVRLGSEEPVYAVNWAAVYWLADMQQEVEECPAGRAGKG